jgi:hypothetical protein
MILASVPCNYRDIWDTKHCYKNIDKDNEILISIMSIHKEDFKICERWDNQLEYLCISPFSNG